MNPYNCTLPGNWFVGYEDLRRELREDLRGGKSFAVLGGRRCGKTLLLLQIEKDLRAQGLRGFQVLPRFLDLQALGVLSPGRLFKSLYELVVQETDAKPWTGGASGNDYEEFLAHLDAAQAVLRRRHGSDWLVVFLVDELDAAIAKLPDDQFFQNLRNLLMVSCFHRHVRLVASGVKEMSRLIRSGSSPLNNLCNLHLRVLAPEETVQLVACGFPEGLGPEVEAALLTLTGRHPYLLQGLLEKLKKKSSALTPQTVHEAAREFLSEHKDFRRWLAGFSPTELAAYQLLADAPGGRLEEGKLRRQLPRSLVAELEEALTVLSFHGVIDDSDPEELQIAGTLFRDWWKQNAPPQELATPAHAGPAPPPGVSATVRLNAQDVLPEIPDHVLAGRRPFGGGAYGRVWLAQSVMGTYRAAKVVYRDAFPEPRPFEREFNGIKQYEPISRAHQGLVQILHVGRNNGAGYFYYLMELGDDEERGQHINPATYSPKNLSKALAKRGRIPLLECVDLGLSLVDAVGFLHQHGLIHRDLKPSNIIFVNGTAKLADIGLVTVMGVQAGDASWVGTEGYIPPEGPGTAAADLFGLGKVLYQACTGLECRRFPDLPADMLDGAGHEAALQLFDITVKACHWNPAERYPSATGMFEDLLRLHERIKPAAPC